MKIKLLTFMFLVTLLSLSCKRNELTREQAQEQIKRKFGYPRVETQREQYSIQHNGKVYLIYGDLYNNTFKKTLNDFNMVKITGVEPWEGAYYGNITLTDKGKKDLVSLNGDTYSFKICEVDLIDVTGIQIFEQNKSARVDYTWKYTNLTNAGQALKQSNLNYIDSDIHQNTVMFQLYDDGWRIQ